MPGYGHVVIAIGGSELPDMATNAQIWIFRATNTLTWPPQEER
jgi:hypothetical protein